LSSLLRCESKYPTEGILVVPHHHSNMTDEKSFISDLHCDSCDIHDLAHSLVRSMESNHDIHNIPQPDLTLAKLLAKQIADLKTKIETRA
jgi:hypothetical protein